VGGAGCSLLAVGEEATSDGLTKLEHDVSFCGMATHSTKQTRELRNFTAAEARRSLVFIQWLLELTQPIFLQSLRTTPDVTLRRCTQWCGLVSTGIGNLTAYLDAENDTGSLSESRASEI
jgi:hypothetical protein